MHYSNREVGMESAVLKTGLFLAHSSLARYLHRGGALTTAGWSSYFLSFRQAGLRSDAIKRLLFSGVIYGFS